MLYLLQRQTNLQTNTLQIDFRGQTSFPGILTGRTIEDNNFYKIPSLHLSNKVTTDSMTKEHQYVTASHPV